MLFRLRDVSSQSRPLCHWWGIRSVLATVMLGKKARNDSAASEPDFAVFLIQICSGVHSSSSGVH